MSDDTAALAEFFRTSILLVLAILLGGILSRLDRLVTLQEKYERTTVCLFSERLSEDEPGLTEENSRLLEMLQEPPDDAGAAEDSGG